MPTIDQLNFEVILDDANFQQKVQADLQLARDLNVNLTQALNVAATRAALNIDGTNALNSVAQLQNAIQQLIASTTQRSTVNVDTSQSRQDVAMLKTALDNILAGINNINNTPVNPKTNLNNLNQFNNGLREQGVILNQLRTLAVRYFSIYGLTRFLGQLVQITGEFEVQQMALRTILNDAEKADEIFNKLRQFAVESPFTFQELAKYTKQLAAFDIPTEKLLDTNKMLADVSAGLGVSMDRLILAYGHVKSSGFLRGMQLRQFTQNGVPILEQLSDILSEIEGKAVSVGNVFDRMTKRQIDFSMVEEAFRRMTSEGGKFYQMQEVLVETVKGRMGKLRDVWQQAVYDLGESQSGTLKGIIDFITNLVRHLDTIVRVMAPVVVALGTYTAGLLAAAAAQKAMAVAEFAKKLLILVTHLNQAAKVMRIYNLSAASVAGAVALVISGVIALANAISRHNKELNAAANKYHEFENANAATNRELQSLFWHLEQAKVGTEEYQKAVDRLISRYGNYLSAMDKENLRLGQTEGLYEKIAIAAKEAAKEKFISAGMDELTDNYNNSVKKWQRAHNNFMKHLEKEKPEIQAEISDYLRGMIDITEVSPTARSIMQRVVDTQFVRTSSTIRNGFKQAEDALAVGMEKLNSLFERATKDTGKGVPAPELSEWEKRVKKAVDRIAPEIKGKMRLDIKPQEDYYEYLERLGKEYKELSEMRDKALAKDKKGYAEQLKAIQAVDKALEGNILSDPRYTRTPWSAADEKTRKEIKDLTTKINTLKKLKDAYESLTEYVSDAKAREILTAAFGDDATTKAYIDNNEFLADNIQKVVDELNKLDPNKAESLSAALGKDDIADTVAEWKKLQEVTKRYFEFFRSWTTEDTDIEGKGFFYDLSKVGTDLETKLNKLELQAVKAKEMLATLAKSGEDSMEIAVRGLIENGVDEQTAREFWNTWVTGGSEAIDKFVDEYSGKMNAAAREKVTGLAKDYLEEAYFLEGVDLTHISDKTMAQLRTLKEKLLTIMSNLDVSGVDLAGLGIDVDNLTEEALANPEVAKAIDETTMSTLRLMLAVQKASGSWDDFTAAVKAAVEKGLKNLDEEQKKNIYEFANAFIKNVTSMGTAYKEFAETTGNDSLASLIEGFEALGEIAGNALERLAKGDVPGAVVSVIAGIWKEIAKAVTQAARLKAAIADVAFEAEKLNFSSRISEGVESIFGEDTIRQVRNAAKEVQRLEKSYRSIDEIQLVKPVAIEWKTGLFNWGRKSKDLRAMIAELGYSYFDKYGNINAEALDKVLETYSDLTAESKQWIEEAKRNSEEYADAMKVIEDASSSLFNNVADEAADTIIDSWIEAGNAALDYADILDDVARSYAKMVLKSAIMDQFFNEEKAKEIVKLFASGQDKEAMGLIADALQGVTESAPLWEKILEAFDPYFNRSASEASSLGESIKNSITEEQANLIASYINAMRADLSYMRGRQTEYFDYMLGSMPSLADHVASIEAHTYDMMQSNAAIASSTASALSALQSIIGTTTGLPAVRVEAAM